LHGFLNINKGPGLTSFAVLKKLQKLIPKNKLGHLGTLDPMATGVLPVALGHATRLIEYMEDTEKVYQATMTLGGISDTQDAWGKIEATGQRSYCKADLLSILAEYTGMIQQIPPMYSAVHYQGTRLYELARQGIEVERPARQIEIISLQMLGSAQDEAGQPTIDLEIQCSQGTYIRTLCHDIGQKLGTGAYMSKLIRTRAGLFRIEEALTLEELAELKPNIEAHLMPLDFPLQHWPALTLNNAEDNLRVNNGNHVKAPADLPAGLIRIYNPENQLLAIAKTVSESDYYLAQPLKVFK